MKLSGRSQTCSIWKHRRGSVSSSTALRVGALGLLAMLALVAPALLVQYGSFHCYNISHPIEAKSRLTGESEVIESQAEAEWFCSETCVADPVACVPICIGSDCNGATVESLSLIHI